MISLKDWTIGRFIRPRKPTNGTQTQPSSAFRLSGMILQVQYFADIDDVPHIEGDHKIIGETDGSGVYLLVSLPDPVRDPLVERFLKCRDIDQFTAEEREIILYPGGRPSK